MMGKWMVKMFFISINEKDKFKYDKTNKELISKKIE